MSKALLDYLGLDLELYQHGGVCVPEIMEINVRRGIWIGFPREASTRYATSRSFKMCWTRRLLVGR